jgi:hypothetical protein
MVCDNAAGIVEAHYITPHHARLFPDKFGAQADVGKYYILISPLILASPDWGVALTWEKDGYFVKDFEKKAKGYMEAIRHGG